MKHIVPVPEQMVIDSDFSTVESPNPENPEAFTWPSAWPKRWAATLS